MTTMMIEEGSYHTTNRGTTVLYLAMSLQYSTSFGSISSSKSNTINYLHEVRADSVLFMQEVTISALILSSRTIQAAIPWDVPPGLLRFMTAPHHCTSSHVTRPVTAPVTTIQLFIAMSRCFLYNHHRRWPILLPLCRYLRPLWGDVLSYSYIVVLSIYSTLKVTMTFSLMPFKFIVIIVITQNVLLRQHSRQHYKLHPRQREKLHTKIEAET